MMDTKLNFISMKAATDRSMKFNNLMHLVNERNLCECFGRLKKGKAPGVDNVTLEEYGKHLHENVAELVARMKRMSYRPQPVRRSYIPKSGGKKRGLGIPALEDKLVQMAFSRILESIWEVDFLDFSYGFRPNRGCHIALSKLDELLMKRQVGYVIDADIEGYFDNVDHQKLVDCLKERITDKTFLRYIVRMLKSGVIDGRSYYASEKGTPQGGVVSPVLANIYLHYLLDLWFVRDLLPDIRGYAGIIRYCDDFVIVMESEADTLEILHRLEERLGQGKLNLSKAKTRIVRFERPKAGKTDDDRHGKEARPGTFSFLGFTHYWEKSRKGFYKIGRKTASKSFRAAISKVTEWLRSVRNQMPLKDIWIKASQKLYGHYGYYGVSGNYAMIQRYRYLLKRLLFKWLNRRSQKKSFNWKQFSIYEERFPLPKPKIYHQLYKRKTLSL